ncbi:MAG: primosomal protein N' [Pseudomonadota bacterium]|nr:primosomal protein N' [Pseudomonadota bacterium]
MDCYLTYGYFKLLSPGSIVLVSLRKKNVLGIIIKRITKPISIPKIKGIEIAYSDKRLSNYIIDFIIWFSSYNIVNKGSALKLFLPNQKIIEEAYKKIIGIKKLNKFPTNASEKKIYTYLANKPKNKKELYSHFKKDTYLLRKLISKNFLYEEFQKEELQINFSIKKINLKKLTQSQRNAYNQINDAFIKVTKKPVFLDGVTGSGKTEVYFKLIKDALLNKKQVLVLLPEIALSEQWLKRFNSTFGFYPAVWNSKITLPEKRKVWNAALSKKPLVVIGARSSLFLPYQNLDLIIIDEENDYSYKQEKGIIYNARDMAVLKSKIENINILLVSATPSLETYKNCIDGKYKWIKIANSFNSVAKPKVNIVDMRKSSNKLLSKDLEVQVKKNIKNKKQSLILINRRGYSPVLICEKCGAKRKCKYCDSNMVYHKEENFVMCHQCGRKEQTKAKCLNCGNEKFILIGFGLEKIYEEATKLFDGAKIVKLSSDFVEKENFLQTLKKIEQNKVDIIVGTQIISKGFDFDNIKSVFIIDFDLWFNNANIRTNERIFQLTLQVTGRAGRRKERGEVFIQTFDPKNKLLYDIIRNKRDRFYNNELEVRSKAQLPPFGRLLSITISSRYRKLAEEKAKIIKDLFSNTIVLKVLGPIPATIFYINQNYRYKLLIKSIKPYAIQNYTVKKKLELNNNHRVKVTLDVDPYSIY